ncbi:esterase-like activity of phytase family protein [Streptomyces sp. NPDC059718]
MTEFSEGSEPNACSAWAVVDWFSDALDKTCFEEKFVGNMSALAVSPEGRVAALADRSLLFHLDAATHEPVEVVALYDENGKETDFEALVFDEDGTLLIASEEPAVRRYTPEGKFIDSLPVPDSLLLAPAGRAVVNETFEGLAMQPGGLTLVASMEGALRGDESAYVRFQAWKRETTGDEFRIGVQWGYVRDKGLLLSDICASGDGRLLVLERGFDKSVGNIIRVYLADPREADDITHVENLSGQDDVSLMNKTLLVDMVNCPPLGATNKQSQANPLLGNIEGMTITGTTPDGRLKVLMVTDDNQSDMQTTRLYGMTIRLPEL